MANRRIFGVDPGTAIVGYSVLDNPSPEAFQCITCGVIRTDKALKMGERLKIIRDDLLSLFEEYRPDVIAVEAIFFFKNAKTLVPVAQSRGVILEASTAFGIPVFEYTPMEVKLNLTGYGRADKKMVQFTLAKLLGHDEIIRPDDAADAVALAICHARMNYIAPIAEPTPVTGRLSANFDKAVSDVIEIK